MEKSDHKKSITVEIAVNVSLQTAWNCWTEPEHITQWNFASEDWHCPKATNDLNDKGKFNFTMAARDGSVSFDFEGTYIHIENLQRIEYEIVDGRKVNIQFTPLESGTLITEEFEMENMNSEDLQRAGWQAILENFKKHAESL